MKKTMSILGLAAATVVAPLAVAQTQYEPQNTYRESNQYTQRNYQQRYNNQQAATYAPRDNHFYVGGDLGVTNIGDLDDETLAGIFVGYQFNPYFRVEAGVRSMASDDWQYWEGDWYVDEEFTLSSLQVSALGVLPIGKQVNLYGRLGLAYVEAETEFYEREYDVFGYAYGRGYHYTISDSESLAFGGVGVEAYVWNNLNIFAEYTAYEDFLGADLSSFSVGAKWHFR